jgi:hypothetical protein
VTRGDPQVRVGLVDVHDVLVPDPRLVVREGDLVEALLAAERGDVLRGLEGGALFAEGLHGYGVVLAVLALEVAADPADREYPGPGAVMVERLLLDGIDGDG